MPAIKDSSLVLLTGASGFLAAHVGQQLLQRGYRVRGTVRSEAKGEYLKNLYEKDGLKGFEYVIVEDIEQDGAFDEAVKGVDAVAHTASPFHFRVDDPHKDLINPAVQGTKGLLTSALKEPKIQRVVITSSFASVVNPYDPVYTFTEDDWNTFSPKEVETKGTDVEPSQAYRASKTLAEKAAWAFVEENTKDGEAPFDIATINPPLIFGPIIHQIEKASSLNTSVAAFYAYLQGEKSDKDAGAASGSYVDVRDVARLHIDALATPDASNKRFCVSNSAFAYQDLLDLLHTPENEDLLKSFPKAVKGVPGTPTPKQNVIDTTRARKTFKWEPIPTSKMVVDMTKSLAERQKEW